MRCLILGGAGFIGSHVAQRLAAAGHGVRIFDLKPHPHAVIPSQAECVWSDWRNRDAVYRAACGIDVVVHLICTTWPGRAGHGSVFDWSSNILPSLQVFRICVQQGVRKIVFLSSGGTVYGVPKYTPIDEGHPVKPISSYGMIKLITEHYLDFFFRTCGLEYVILRGANVYGEYHNSERSQGALNVFLRKIARRQPIEIWGNGQVVRDYLYVGDMARAIQCAVESSLRAEIFNVGSGRGTTLTDLLEIVSAETGRVPVAHYHSGRKCDVPVNILAIDKIRKLLGWIPEMSLSEGIRRTWNWTQSIER